MAEAFDIGQRVRLVRDLDLGGAGMIPAGTVGILVSAENSSYLPYLVEIDGTTYAFEDTELAPA
ncbi:MAG TPA: hypothetical protein VNJ51_14760 [Candidatus Dormibacteraeota bacterium]|nr:hypothetical protein [Candidatus Dormibacteraeota bacterium]